MSKTDELLRPIVGVENRTAQEVFDIMCDRIAAWNRRTAQPAVKALLETLETTAQRLKNAEWEDGASSDHVRRVLREGADVCNAAIAALVSAPADPAPAPADERPWVARIAEVLDEGDGFWRSCSGCHELNDGAPTGEYSAAFRSHVGLGCSECGGLGVIWDTTDYGAMASALAREEPALRAAPAGDVVEALNPDALAALKNGQRQLDQDGVEVGVSRQALDELIAAFEARTALSAQGWRTPGEFQELHIIFQDDGGPANLRFVEVETPDGKSVRAGTWLKRDGYDVLALTVHKSDLPAAPSEGHAALEQEGR